MADAVPGFERSSGAAAWLLAHLTEISAVSLAELAKLRHDRREILIRALQPAVWLLLAGGLARQDVMLQAWGLSAGGRYLDFVTPGLLAQSTVFAALFHGAAAIWERDLGVLNRYLVSPASRSVLVLGKAVPAAARGLAQAVMVYILAVLLGVAVDFRTVNLLGVILLLVLGSGLFSTLSLIIACLAKTRERFMGAAQALALPLLFASTALYPLDIMPKWLQIAVRANPLSYEVDGLRALMLRGPPPSPLEIGIDILVPAAVFAVLAVVAARLYPRLAQ